MPSPHAEGASLSPNTQGTRECQQTVHTHYITQDPLPYCVSPRLSALHQRSCRNHSCLMNALRRSISLQRLLSHIKQTNLYAFLLLICLVEQFRLQCQREQKEASFFPDATKRFSISHPRTTLIDLLLIYTADDGNHFPMVRR